MEYRSELTGRAIADARLIYDRMAEHSPERAEKWFDGLIARIETLRTFPYRCPRVDESEKFGEDVRHLIYGKRQSTYRILL